MNSATGPVEHQQTWGERVAVLERELASMQAEREQYKAALARAVAAMDYLHGPGCGSPGCMNPRCVAVRSVLADPTGQQAVQEWARFRAVEESASRLRKLQRLLEAHSKGQIALANVKVVQETVREAYNDLDVALVTLQQPEGQK